MDRLPTWLPQRPPGSGAVLLRDHPGELVELECPRCGRAGRYRRAGLMQRFGPAAGMPDVLATLSGDCPRRGVGQYGDPCGARLLL